MHQDRNNGNWPELKRKKQRLSTDEDLHKQPRSRFKNFENKNFQLPKKIKANDNVFNNGEKMSSSSVRELDDDV